MIKTFKALSALLQYPSPELQQAIPDIADVLADEQLVAMHDRMALTPLLDRLARGDIYDLQEDYVLLFDRSRQLSLNLFEHIHGESRDRGGAMVDLLETYRAGGFDLVGPELPDHLPVLLEFLATRPQAAALEILADAAPILALLADRLVRRATPYAAALSALAELGLRGSAERPDTGAAEEPLEDPEDLQALDAIWEEAQVTFAPDPNAGCPVSRELLAQMDTPVAPARAGTAH